MWQIMNETKLQMLASKPCFFFLHMPPQEEQWLDCCLRTGQLVVCTFSPVASRFAPRSPSPSYMPKNMHVRSIGTILPFQFTSHICPWVCFSANSLCLSLWGSVINWWLVQGVVLLSPHGSWERDSFRASRTKCQGEAVTENGWISQSLAKSTIIMTPFQWI